MKRRNFLLAGAGGIAAIEAGCTLFDAPEPYPSFRASEPVIPVGALRRLLVERIDPLSGQCHYRALVSTAPATERADARSEPGGFRLNMLGGLREVVNPVLIGRAGEHLDFVIENRLPQATTVHFHGLTLPETQDGAGFDPIPSGASKRVSFELRNRAGLYWYHAHPHGHTAEQIQAGLVGLVIMVDEDDRRLDESLALAPGNRLALVLADQRLRGDLRLPYAPDPRECAHGWFGNAMAVNGTLEFTTDCRAGWVRLQLLNACNARGLLVGIRHGQDLLPFFLLGTDGGLLPEAVPVDQVFLYPAERIDIAIDLPLLVSDPASGAGATGHIVSAISLPFAPRHQVSRTPSAPRTHLHDAEPPLSATALCTGADSTQGASPSPTSPFAPVPVASAAATASVQDGAPLALFHIRVRSQAPSSGPAPGRLPARLSALPPAPRADPAFVRQIRLDFDEAAGYVIDGTTYSSDEPGITIARGGAEIWEIRNSPLSMPHPMHLHGFSFRVLRRRGTFGPARALTTHGNGRLATDLGLKDTVVVWPNETVWIEIDFSLPLSASFDGRQRYLFHCHNLAHGDAMMMRKLVIP